MHLSARLLNDVSGVNHFSYTDTITINEGDSATIYFQLANISVDKELRPCGRRYIPETIVVDDVEVLATVEVTLKSLNTGNTVTKSATQPFVEDPSIWSFALDADETLPGTKSMKIVLEEPIADTDPQEYKATNGWVEQAIVVSPMSPEF